MIQKSDLVILVLASSALAAGVLRWHQNTQAVSAITIPASSRDTSEPIHGGTTAPILLNSHIGAVNTAIPTKPDEQIRVQTILEPQPETEIIVTEPTAPSTSNSDNLGIHQVRSGDVLSRIARQYGTTVQTLRELNDINGSLIQIGQEIFYPL